MVDQRLRLRSSLAEPTLFSSATQNGLQLSTDGRSRAARNRVWPIGVRQHGIGRGLTTWRPRPRVLYASVMLGNTFLERSHLGPASLQLLGRPLYPRRMLDGGRRLIPWLVTFADPFPLLLELGQPRIDRSAGAVSAHDRVEPHFSGGRRVTHALSPFSVARGSRRRRAAAR